jgi:hypothetical protein
MRRKSTLLGRFREKAKKTRERHAKGRGVTASQMEKLYGWEIDRMAHDMEHAFKNGCPYCEIPFSSMGGLHSLTVDILNRDLLPHWNVNKTLCCSTCNAEKQGKTPEQWAEHLICWKRWHNDPRPPQRMVWEVA